MRPHNLILQKLDQYLTNFGGKVFYPRKTFESVNYTGKPVILWAGKGYPRHPDFGAVDAGNLPPEYRIVGQITNTAIDGDLQRADAIITDGALDAEMSANPAAFAVSSGFWGDIVNGVMSVVRAPNHVLLFRRSVAPNARPNDPGAQVCNVAEQSIYPVSLDTGIQKMVANQNQTNQPAPNPVQVGNAPAPDPEPAETPKDGEQSELEQLRAENEQLKALASQLVTQLQEIQAAMQQATAQQQAPAAAAPAAQPMAVGNVAAEATAEIERLRKKCADYEWQTMEPNLPPAMRGVAGRTAYTADPLKFLQDAISAKTAPKQVVNRAPAEGVTIAPPASAAPTEPTTFLTPEYAGARQIGNVKPPENQIEGARIGKHKWMLFGGIKLDLSEMERW